MKHCLLSVSSKVPSVNIGDYIQALASSQFLPSVDGFIDREALKDYQGDECKMIMNGWYMHHPVQWPPSPKIHPLFVAMHINLLAKERMLMDDSIAYLKQHEPIGTRDLGTRDMLLAHGVEAYFSGCMTLTLGYKYKYEGERKGVYFVDPVVHLANRWEKIVWFLRSLLHLPQAWRISRKYHREGHSRLYGFAFASKFFHIYRRYFTEETLLNATYIGQQSTSYLKDYPSDEERLQCAEDLVRKYAKAQLVVTSRIHCALPCLGIETPVLYLYDDHQPAVSSCRMDGLLPLFNLIHVSDTSLYSSDIDLSKRIDANTHLANKTTWQPLAAALIERCRKFIEKA